MMTAMTESEVRYRIEQAFALVPCMTMGMLKAHLNARVPIDIRTSVLEELKSEGKVILERKYVQTYHGRTSCVILLRWKEELSRAA